MTTSADGGISIGSFARVFGDLERSPYGIPGFDRLWRAQSDADFAAMGCERFRAMSGPLETYVLDCLQQVLAHHGVPAAEVDHVVFSTSDGCLRSLDRDFAVRVLEAAGLEHCVPAVISLQQCCSSLTALRYGWDLFADAAVNRVVVVSLDFTPEDHDRVRSFALFSDAVVGCLISRSDQGSLRLVSSAVGVDHAGLLGRDTFASRQKVAQESFAKVFSASDASLAQVAKVFPANLYEPVTLFNATVTGVRREQLHFTDVLRDFGHCGNCDWMINMMDFESKGGFRTGELYLAQSTAPGFFACGLLAAV